MPYFIDFATSSVNKKGEELCGDHVETIKTKEGMIVVLSDGLGSGVKANILATLTSKIAITMLKEGASIEDTIFTITNTLPECQVRKLAYSTFTILQIQNDGTVYMVEYDNPPVFYYRKNTKHPVYKSTRFINNKMIYESHFTMRVGDTLAVVSDGAVHAGVGCNLNLGWQWEHIDDYLESLIPACLGARDVANQLLEVCDNLYDYKPGDDTTVCAVRLIEKTFVDIFVGPPKSKEDDYKLIEAVNQAKGKIVLCGGTTAKIVAQAWQTEVKIDLAHYTQEVPPLGKMPGVDLVTEGLLTLNQTEKILENYTIEEKKKDFNPSIHGKDGASRLASMLIRDGTHIHFHVGQAVNPAHQNPDFPECFNFKNILIENIAKKLQQIGKVVEVHYL